ncbi:MAG: dTMP kinase [Actinobacteria bacterium]|nr:dTMP kinase [Actinomycetota bacterium]
MIKNLFITFEGCEGTGKSSQLKLLVNTLKKTPIKFIATREPGGSKEGERIREILLNHRLTIQPFCETLLHMAARYQNLKKVIFPALKSGKWVLCDRYTDSTIAYQGYGHGVGPQKIKKISKITFGDLEPDITFILDMPTKKALKRAKLRKIDFNRYERMGISFHNKVRRAFLKIAKKDSKRCFVLNAEKDRKEIHQEIKEIINKTYKTKLK